TDVGALARNAYRIIATTPTAAAATATVSIAFRSGPRPSFRSPGTATTPYPVMQCGNRGNVSAQHRQRQSPTGEDIEASAASRSPPVRGGYQVTLPLTSPPRGDRRPPCGRTRPARARRPAGARRPPRRARRGRRTTTGDGASCPGGHLLIHER